jgi:hypothetical protein
VSQKEHVEWPDMPPGVEDRDADVWEALLAVADLAGGHWPTTARKAAVTLVTESRKRLCDAFPKTMAGNTIGPTLSDKSFRALLDAIHALEDRVTTLEP